MSGTSTASLSSATQSAAARARVVSDACSGKASSTSLIFATGLKTCSPTNSSGRPDASASSDDRQRRGRRAEDRVRPGDPVELREQVALQRRVLAHRLDEERRLGERVEVGDDLHALGVIARPRVARRSSRSASARAPRIRRSDRGADRPRRWLLPPSRLPSCARRRTHGRPDASS